MVKASKKIRPHTYGSAVVAGGMKSDCPVGTNVRVCPAIKLTSVLSSKQTTGLYVHTETLIILWRGIAIMLDHRTSRVHMHCWEGLGTKNARLSPDMALLFCMALAFEHLAEFLRSCNPNKAGLLFATRNGTPWDANMVLKRHLKPLFRELNIGIPKGN